MLPFPSDTHFSFNSKQFCVSQSQALLKVKVNVRLNESDSCEIVQWAQGRVHGGGRGRQRRAFARRGPCVHWPLRLRDSAQAGRASRPGARLNCHSSRASPLLWRGPPVPSRPWPLPSWIRPDQPAQRINLEVEFNAADQLRTYLNRKIFEEHLI